MGAELGGGGAGRAKNSCIPHRFLRVSSLSCSIHIAKISCQGRAVELPGYVCVCESQFQLFLGGAIDGLHLPLDLQ